MASSLKHSMERKAFDVAVSTALKYLDKNREKGMIKFIDLMEKILGDTWPPVAYQKLRGIYEDPNSKWNIFTKELFENTDHNMIKTMALNLGYEAAFRGFKNTQANKEKYGVSIPYILLIDPTSACNLKCKGCWSAEYGHKQSLSYETLDDVITQAEELGIHAFMFTGGEPTVRQDDIWKLCEKHNHSYFAAFTNGTLIDDAFAQKMVELGNFNVNISLEGFKEENDARRGEGTFDKVMAAMDALKRHKVGYGLSIAYTSKNYKTVTSDEFYDMVIDKNVKFIWYFHYMPVGVNADTSLLLTPEQREYVYHRIRAVRDFEGGRPLFTIDFQNDGEYIGGCIAGGKYYCHINPAGDVEPCVFVHYSSANIHEKSLLECLQQPLFKAYQKGQPFNDNHLRPCPMLENPQALRGLVKATGAKSTDLEAPDDVDNLCGRCDQYAEHWAGKAKELWEASHPEKNSAGG